MKNKYQIILFITVIFFVSSVFAANPGDVTLVNDNQVALANQDSVQFQLVTNGNGLVTSAVLPANRPGNSQVLSKWDFSDQTNSFTIYIRNVTQKSEYVQCAGAIVYNATHVPISVRGWNDGTKAHCEVDVNK